MPSLICFVEDLVFTNTESSFVLRGLMLLKDLGYDATIEHWENILKRCHPLNIEHVESLIKDARNHAGQTLFDIIVSIILDSDDTGHFCTLEIID